ncbi:MAG TPA: DnaJ domain-containing protein [Candidatus Limnocylindria bacterium]
MNSYYELLGIPPHATEMEIRSAYGRDVLRLQEQASDSKVAQFRAALDAAFATLVDPTKRSAYDEALAAAAQNNVADAADDADAAFRYARRGGLWFAGGALVTAVTYAVSQGTYFLAWGPLLFGGFQLVRGLLRYLTVPSGARQATHLAVLGGLIAVGVLSAGFVGLGESQAAQAAADRDKWNTMIDATSLDVAKASALVNGVASRPGPWDATDSADMANASVVYAGIAEAVANSTAPTRLEWYRAAMAKNFRDAAGIARDYSLLSATSPASAFEALDNRWNDRLDEAAALSDRFQAQEGTAP